MMSEYVTGAMIKTLREKNHMTQAELADKLCVTDKTVSKWENGKGYPDISLLEPLAAAVHVSVAELLAGSAVVNTNASGNMLRSRISVCPICGNVIHSLGEAVISCHGVPLTPAEAEKPDTFHAVSVTRCEDEYYVEIRHEMSKTHYISFIAAAGPDRIQIVKLYPEGSAAARFKINGVRKLYFYCNKDGLFSVDPRAV